MLPRIARIARIGNDRAPLPRGDAPMMRIAMLANLGAFSIVVSQPLFYLLALTAAQRGLSAAAYVELRQGLNRVMNQRLLAVYVVALVTSLVLLGSAYAERNGLVLG